MHEECPEPYEGIRELINTLKKEGILIAHDYRKRRKELPHYA